MGLLRAPVRDSASPGAAATGVRSPRPECPPASYSARPSPPRAAFITAPIRTDISFRASALSLLRLSSFIGLRLLQARLPSAASPRPRLAEGEAWPSRDDSKRFLH